MRIFLNYFTIISIILLQTEYGVGWLAYVFVVLNLVYSLFLHKNSTKLKYDIRYVLLILIIIFSFLANNIPTVFNSEIKFLGFLIVLLFSSNLINNRYLNFNKIEFLDQVNKVFSLFTFICFLGLLFGFFPKINLQETAGGFSGLFNSSMFLAPMCAMVIIYNFYLSPITKKNKILKFIVIITNFYILFLTGSRATLLALILALLFFIFKLYSHNFLRWIKKYWYVGIMVIILLFNLNKVDFLNVFINKFETEERLGFNSRQTLWDNRLSEFESNPIFGIGFNSVNLDISKYEFKEDSNSIEPGSSWLFLLSTLGILGVIIYIAILSDFIKKVLKKNSLYENYILSILFFLIIHMIFEGYIFAVGNIFVYIFYLALSNLVNVNRYNNDTIRCNLHQ